MWHLPPKTGKRRLVESRGPFRSALVARPISTALPALQQVRCTAALPRALSVALLCLLRQSIMLKTQCLGLLGTHPDASWAGMPSDDVDLLLYIANTNVNFQQHIVGECPGPVNIIDCCCRDDLPKRSAVCSQPARLRVCSYDWNKVSGRLYDAAACACASR
jgi:hypothetical protein